MPAPAEPDVVQPKPLPHEVGEQVRDPHEFETVVLHAVPSPPHVGS